MIPSAHAAETLLLLLAIGLSLMMSFFFSGSETAVISANQLRLRHLAESGDADARKTLDFLASAPRLISCVLIGTNLGNVLAVLLFKMLLIFTWEDLHRPAFGYITRVELISLLVLTPIIVVFAEILPKALFRARANAWIGHLRIVLSGAMMLFSPAIRILDAIVAMFMRPLGGEPAAARGISRRDLIVLLGEDDGEDLPDAGISSQAIPENVASETLRDLAEAIREPDERRLIQNIIGLEKTNAREIMQPLAELETVHLGTMTPASFIEMARRSGHSRFPVYPDRVTNLTGFIEIYDVLNDTTGSQSLEMFVRDATYVPETKRVDDLLQDFLTQRIKTAIVVDEYGGCSGWIAREDILEEIVGELEDELDEPTVMISEEDEGVYRIDGRVDTEDVSEVLKIDLDDSECNTIGGLVMKELGRIGSIDDEVVVGGWRMRVTEVDGMRIARIEASLTD